MKVACPKPELSGLMRSKLTLLADMLDNYDMDELDLDDYITYNCYFLRLGIFCKQILYKASVIGFEECKISSIQIVQKKKNLYLPMASHPDLKANHNRWLYLITQVKNKEGKRRAIKNIYFTF